MTLLARDCALYFCRLMMLNQRGVHQATDYARIIREYVGDNSGRAGRRRQIVDPREHPSLQEPTAESPRAFEGRRI